MSNVPHFDKSSDAYDLYWNTETKIDDVKIAAEKEIKGHIELHSNKINTLISPMESGEQCRHCEHPTYFFSRTDKKAHITRCTSCKHVESKSQRCECKSCREEKKAEFVRKVEMENKRYAHYLENIQQSSYAQKKLSSLPLKEEVFLSALIHVLEERSYDLTAKIDSNDAGLWYVVSGMSGIHDYESTLKELINQELLIQERGNEPHFSFGEVIYHTTRYLTLNKGLLGDKKILSVLMDKYFEKKTNGFVMKQSAQSELRKEEARKQTMKRVSQKWKEAIQFLSLYHQSILYKCINEYPEKNVLFCIDVLKDSKKHFVISSYTKLLEKLLKAFQQYSELYPKDIVEHVFRAIPGLLPGEDHLESVLKEQFAKHVKKNVNRPKDGEYPNHFLKGELDTSLEYFSKFYKKNHLTTSASPGQVKYIRDLLKQKGVQLEDFYTVKYVSDLTAYDAGVLIPYLMTL